jgi:acetolactate synthase-1/2/3 large subunit
VDNKKTYADYFLEMLVTLGYTHCFFVAGGNIMHLLNAARTRMTCVPFVHEVSAGIATEYFNELRSSSSGRAFALVTAGPGLTNIITALAGAWLESRELLVIGGQVKSSDLRDKDLRQRGIQEIDGIALAKPICKGTLQITRPDSLQVVADLIEFGATPRKGPVFIEICIDTQGALSNLSPLTPSVKRRVSERTKTSPNIATVVYALMQSKRPILLVGGGVSREVAWSLMPRLSALGLPFMSTWNGADRIDATLNGYLGRPNTWGQRSANVILQQADLLVALGTRLGLQQTGFNWEEFCPQASIIQVDIDELELKKGHPHLTLGINDDANAFLKELVSEFDQRIPQGKFKDWLEFAQEVRSLLPLNDDANQHRSDVFISPYDLVLTQSKTIPREAIFLPCSSGGAATVSMQTFEPTARQKVLGNKSLAAMGYGLAGAVGAAMSNPGDLILLNEGDGGFAQNLQELGTVKSNNLNIKVFIWANDGYASIRMTQKNYFQGAWVGCDASTGLGLPNWKSLAGAFDLPFVALDALKPLDKQLFEIFSRKGPEVILVPIDPNQTYFPKISSRVKSDGSMESAPLHQMTPSLSPEVEKRVLRYL